jgi:chorismate-pyruvate lyase
MRKKLFFSIFIGAGAALSASGAVGAAQWPDGFLSRVEVLALIQTLNASLLSSRSATATLEKWCADHRMSVDPKVVARRAPGVDKTPSAETKERLGVGPGEGVAYRHVELSCGGHVLSEADNWYVPGRLTADMNRALETTETPFGKVVAPLHPFRRTIEMKMRWSPLPEGWELGSGPQSGKDGGGAMALPHELFEHTAVLYGTDQKPFSEVHETYMSEALDFEPGAAAKGKE